jgi:isopenicillin N synthase-like dioxygenase
MKSKAAHEITDFESRKEEITKQLVDAAENAGFLILVDHGISIKEIEAQFSISKAFFGLSPEIKGKTPHSRKDNNGWEYMVRFLRYDL